MPILVRGFNGDCMERRTSSEPGPVPPPKGPVVITAPVGVGGKNLRQDVLIIQAALNDIEPSDGGPFPKLKVDGISGPRTANAISGFQRRAIAFVDSRIDPDGPTLKAINQRRVPMVTLGFAITETPFFEDQTVVEEVLQAVPTIRAALFLTKNRIENVAPFVGANGLTTPTGPGSERNAFNLALLDECFRLSDFIDPRGAFNRIRNQFESMLQTLRTCDPSRGPIDNGLFLRNRSLLEERGPGAPAAYVIPFGKFAPEATVKLEDGTLVSTKHVHICGGFRTTRGQPRRIKALVTHELAHFVSPPGFHVGDILRGHSDVQEHRFRTAIYDRVSNAENYAWFTWRSFEGSFPF